MLLYKASNLCNNTDKIYQTSMQMIDIYKKVIMINKRYFKSLGDKGLNYWVYKEKYC